MSMINGNKLSKKTPILKPNELRRRNEPNPCDASKKIGSLIKTDPTSITDMANDVPISDLVIGILSRTINKITNDKKLIKTLKGTGIINLAITMNTPKHVPAI